MRNRAKCKLCKNIIESKYEGDNVHCECGEISIDGGNERLSCASLNWENFLRVDDEGNEIIVTIKEMEKNVPDKKELIEMLDEMIKSYENLPTNAMLTPVNHYDLVSALLLMSSILKN